ncbi:MAG: heavy-metal-associated domain-containing protein [Candidatus Kapaibacteriota bacterium]
MNMVKTYKNGMVINKYLILLMLFTFNILSADDNKVTSYQTPHNHLEIVQDTSKIILTNNTKTTEIIENKDGFTTAKIYTTAECGKCKKAIEKAINRLDGIKSAVLDVDSRMFTVKFKNDEIDLAKIKTVINKAGYDADETKAEPKAYDKLPECCKVDGMKK